jgi:chemotaxis protein methyltransferase CheR
VRGVEELELALLLEGIERRYGFDFRDYALPALRRRVQAQLRAERLPTISALQERLLREPTCFERLVTAIASSGAGLFQDPGFYRAFRRHIAPALRGRRRPRVWHMSCASGEEVYSLAVVLHEERLRDLVQVYATDIHEAPLRQASAGSFPMARLRAAEARYRATGGRARFRDYYTVAHGQGVFRPELRHNIVFAPHNLATDASFNEFEVILCGDLLGRLGCTLQDRVHRLVHDSLARAGFLGLGAGASPAARRLLARYQPVDVASGLFQKVP